MIAARREIVGVIPAAGTATRIAPLPCSKELYRIGFRSAEDGRGVRPKPIGQYLLEHLRRGGAKRTYIVIRKGKWDIPEYFGDGGALDLADRVPDHELTVWGTVHGRSSLPLRSRRDRCLWVPGHPN
jgi:UTP-glucose-1-phosphate uridylyltransferase